MTAPVTPVASCPPEPSATDVVRAVHDLLMRVPPDSEPLPDALRRVEGMDDLHRQLLGIRKMVSALCKGDLHHSCKERGFVAGALKSLQSDLRHLTWQVQRVARGEYQHRAAFMGDFSEAFNTMVEELDKSVSALTQLSQKYKELSCKDPLTGLLNRRAFLSLAIDTLGHTVEKNTPVSVIMADVDHFKKINDTYGHACGDTVLQAVAAKITSFLRSMDICCRYGGEEFLLLLPGSALQNSIMVAERLRQAVEQMSIVADNATVTVTASFGVNELLPRSDSQCLMELLKAGIGKADQNLYRAKETGRNRVVWSVQPQGLPQASGIRMSERADVKNALAPIHSTS